MSTSDKKSTKQTVSKESEPGSEGIRNLIRRAFTMLVVAAGQGARMAEPGPASIEDLLVSAKDIQFLANILVDSIESSIGAASTLETIELARAAMAGDRMRLQDLADKLEAGGFTNSAAATRKVMSS